MKYSLSERALLLFLIVFILTLTSTPYRIHISRGTLSVCVYMSVCKIWAIRNGKVTIFTRNKSFDEIDVSNEHLYKETSL